MPDKSDAELIAIIKYCINKCNCRYPAALTALLPAVLKMTFLIKPPPPTNNTGPYLHSLVAHDWGGFDLNICKQ